jgi:polysaccharide export outer membrane protein
MRGNARLKFNYKAAIKGKNLDQNVFLEPGDIIIVK